MKIESLYSVGVGPYNQAPRLARSGDGNLWVGFISVLPKLEAPSGPASMGAFLHVRNRKGWPFPVVLSGPPAVPQSLDLCADREGKVWAVWTERGGDGGWRLKASRPLDPDGIEWLPPLTIAEGEAELDASACPHPAGGIAVAWCSFDGRTFRTKVARLTEEGGIAWRTALPPEGTHAFRPAISPLGGGLLVAFEVFSLPARYVLACSQVDGEGRPREPLLLSDEGDFNGFPVSRPSPDGEGAWVCWCSRFGNLPGARGLVRCALIRPDGSAVFVPSALEGAPPGAVGASPLKPALSLDGEGRVWVAGSDHKGVESAPLWLKALTSEGWAEAPRLGPEEEGFHRYYRATKRPFQTEASLLWDEGRLLVAFTHWVTNHGPRMLYLAELDAADRAAGPPKVGERRDLRPLDASPLPRTPWEGPGVAFADLHAHSLLSYDAFGAPDEWLLRARYEKGLQVAALTDHDKTVVDHALCDALCRCLSARGEFVALGGYEDCFAPPSVGDKVVLCFEDGAPIYWSMLQLGHPWPPREDFLGLIRRSGKVLLISHDGWMFNADQRGGICDRDRWEGKLSPVVQVTSGHARGPDFERFSPGESRRPEGFFRWLDALRRGFRYGAVGGSDSHWPDPQPRTGLLLSELTKEEVWRALRERRCFALENVKVGMELRANDLPMGSELRVGRGEEVCVRGRAWAASGDCPPLRSLELVRNGEVVAASYGPASELRLHFEDRSEGPCFLYLRATLEDGRMAFSSPVWLDRT